MSRFVSPAGLSALALIAAALLLGLVSGRAELFIVSVPLTLRLLAGARPTAPPRYTLTHEVSARRLFEGERLTVTLTLTAEAALPQVEALELLPAGAELLSGNNRTVVAARAGQTVKWSYELGFPERARVTLGVVHLRFWRPAGLGAYEATHVDPKMVHVYPRAAPLRRLPVPLSTQTSVGNYVSPAVGEGLEPGEVRPFAPGDRIRHVNWRASLRSGGLFVTRYQQERNADVVLMLDTLSEAGAGSTSTLAASLRAAASLATAYLARKDRVGLIEYGGVLRWIKPETGRPHLERLLDTLLRAQVTFTYVAKDLTVVPPRVLPPRALVIALSPLLDRRFTVAVGDLAGRGFDLIVIAVDAAAATRASLRPSPLIDAACRLWALERRIELAELRGRGLRVVEWEPDQPIELALATITRHRRPRALAG